MKTSKGKNLIVPDKGWLISDSKTRKRHYKINLKRFFVKTFNRRLRQFFKKEIKNVAEE